MKLEEASFLADGVRCALTPYCFRLEVAGSIRRGKAEVGDIDIVAMAKPVTVPSPLGVGNVTYNESKIWKDLIPAKLKKCGLKVEASGQELLRCTFLDGFQVDIYRARPETWGVILLVRTGGKEHNVKLCTLARSKGLKLSASEGLVAQGGFGQILASRSEEEIFSALGLAYVEPKDREVQFA
jgi:DNA polymerase/3'-5' exonuclease PolX